MLHRIAKATREFLPFIRDKTQQKEARIIQEKLYVFLAQDHFTKHSNHANCIAMSIQEINSVKME